MSAVRELPIRRATPATSFRPGAHALKQALIAGIQRVQARRDAINQINVFPVADGDTGSNLAFTLSVVQDALQRLRTSAAGTMFAHAASAAIDGARGNSGAILAQFLQGVSEALAGVARLQPQVLARAVARGSEQARRALAQPCAGTMLSVFEAFALSLGHQVDSGRGDLRAVFTEALAAVRSALADTPRQLAVLRRAGVVDAGAQGFLELLEGMHEFMLRGRRGMLLPVAFERAAIGVLSNAALGNAALGEDSTHRYCTECVLSAQVLDRDAVHAALKALPASSLVVAGTREKLRVHAHLDEPQLLFDLLARFGSIGAHKAEDMRAQNRAAQSRSMVAVVTDSAADLPAEALERLPLHVVPVRLNFGAQDYLDKISLSSAQFYRKLRESPLHPRTSQPPPGDFRRLFEFLLSHHKELVYVGLSRAVSGTLQCGESAAARTAPERISVLDTRNASCGQGLLAVHAAELAARGHDAQTIARTLQALIPRTLTFAYVRDLSYAVRGGRFPAWALPLTRLLQLVPVARVGRDGRLHLAGVLRARADLPERYAAWIARRLPAATRWRVLVGHCDNRVEGERLCAAVMRHFPDVENCDLVEAGSAIGVHAGPGSLVLSVMPVGET